MCYRFSYFDIKIANIYIKRHPLINKYFHITQNLSIVEQVHNALWSILWHYPVQ